MCAVIKKTSKRFYSVKSFKDRKSTISSFFSQKKSLISLSFWKKKNVYAFVESNDLKNNKFYSAPNCQ